MTRHAKRTDTKQACHKQINRPVQKDNGLYATMIWFGPHSPMLDEPQGQEEEYQFIFFPKK